MNPTGNVLEKETERWVRKRRHARHETFSWLKGEKSESRADPLDQHTSKVIETIGEPYRNRAFNLLERE